MIEGILEEPLALTRHRTAPLLKERELFLSHLLRQGTSHHRVRSIAAYLIHQRGAKSLAAVPTVKDVRAARAVSVLKRQKGRLEFNEQVVRSSLSVVSPA